MKTILTEGFAELGVPVPDGAAETLIRYYELLNEKNKVMNLTAIEGEEDTARQHFLDCGALLRYLNLSGNSVADIGSGAGFPGLVLRILCPDTRLTTLDSLQKRIAFQEEVCTALGLTDVRCIAGRAEEQTELRQSFDIVTSRAVARLTMLAELCMPMVKVGGCFAAMKGPEPEEELEEAMGAIRILGGGKPEVEKYTIPGTDITHSLIIIPKKKATPPKYPRRFAMIKKQPLK